MTWQPPARPGYPTPPQDDYPAPQTSLKAQLFLSFAIGAVFALFVYVARAPAPRALGAGVVIGAGSLFLLRAMDLVKHQWPTAPNGRAARLAGMPRWRLNGFDALTDPRPGLSPDLRARLAVFATAVLSRHELVPGSVGAVELLGGPTHELLFRPPRAATDPPHPDPTAEQVTELIHRLVELGDSRARPGAGGVPSANNVPSGRNIEMEGNR